MAFTPASRREFEVDIALIAEAPAHPALARIRNDAYDQPLSLFVRLASMLRAEDMETGHARHDGRRRRPRLNGAAIPDFMDSCP